MKKYAVIVAGGKGERFGSDVPKQFLLLNGKPVLQHTLNAFSGLADAIIVVLPAAQIPPWETLVKQYNINLPHTIVAGGNSRFQSVYNALQAINEDGIVAVHDGVRPLTTKALIENCFSQALLKGNAVASIALKDSIRELTEGSSKHVNRNNYRLTQTPQVFDIATLKNAYRAPEQSYFTDDASVAEAMGESINLIEGEDSNIKITVAADLKLAETLLGK